MSNENQNIQKAILLHVNGLRLDDIRAVPEVEKLLHDGVVLELEPTLITEPQNQQYQALTGRFPASFGFFDTLMPACHLAQTTQTASGYTIVEEHAGRDTTPPFLAERLQNAGWHVQQATCSSHKLESTLQDLMHKQDSTPICLFITCTFDTNLSATEVTTHLSGALQSAQTWLGATGLLAILSDAQPAPVKQFVNMNNFLADMGIIERDTQTGSIQWPDSLAYFAGSGQLWINLLGREPQGAVHLQDEYEEVRDTLVNALPQKLRDPQTGESVIERVYRKEELYNENFLFCAPDLIVLFKPGYASSPESAYIRFDEHVFTPASPDTTVVAGTHPSSMKGFLVGTAPSLGNGITTSNQLITVVPTLLHALGLDYTGLDASPVQDVYSYSYLADHPLHEEGQEHELSEEDEELVINRLRDLGYI